jgi:predicted component of type VI protein secretion system
MDRAALELLRVTLPRRLLRRAARGVPPLGVPGVAGATLEAVREANAALRALLAAVRDVNARVDAALAAAGARRGRKRPRADGEGDVSRRQRRRR